MTTYLAGQTERITETFSTSAGANTDPTTVAATVKAPDGTTTNKAYPGDITRLTTGIYYFDLTFTQAGVWTIGWTGTGTLAAVDLDSYQVDPNPLLGYGSPARSTLADLIQTVRTLTYAGQTEYSIGTANYWDDVQIQIMLDRHRLDLWRVPMCAIPQQTTGGSLLYYRYSSEYSDLEATAGGTAIFQIQNSIGDVSGTAAWTADYARGFVTFAADQRGTAYYLTARTYDLYGTASELLRAWAAREKLSYDIAPDNQSFRHNQKVKQLREMADEYGQRAWPMVVALVRGDY